MAKKKIYDKGSPLSVYCGGKSQSEKVRRVIEKFASADSRSISDFIRIKLLEGPNQDFNEELRKAWIA